MAQTSVSGCVMSIVASFSTGLDVLRKLKGMRGRKQRSRANKITIDEERRLGTSLRQGPEEIGQQYRLSVQVAGEQVAVGDAIAQTSLAEVLLKLNTGLVGIITSFLSHDKKEVDLDYQSLTNLSESSRLETCRLLRSLSRRLMIPKARPDADAVLRLPGLERAIDKERRRQAVQKQARNQAPTLARVSIQDSSKPSQVALVKPGERRKKAIPSVVSPMARSAASTPSISSPPPYEVAQETSTRPDVHRSHTEPVGPQARRKQSSATMKELYPRAQSGMLHASRSRPRVQARSNKRVNSSPAQLDSTPPSAEVAMPRQRKATPTYYSVDSGSTKLGEIPLHRWAQPFDFDAMSSMNHEAQANDRLTPNDSLKVQKQRCGFLGLFRRKKSAAAA